MITDKTIVFYKDPYDTIYIVDKIDYVNACDIEFKTTVLTPRIYSKPEKIRIQNNTLFKYGTVEIRREVYRLSGPVGVMSNSDTFVSNTPLNQNTDTGKTVTLRNYYNGTLTQVSAIISSIANDLKTVQLSYQLMPDTPLIGAEHQSFKNSYELLTSGAYYGEDYIRISYTCYDAQEGCGSRIVSLDSFRFGPRDNFRWHLDNAISDSITSEISDGSAFSDVGIYYNSVLDVKISTTVGDTPFTVQGVSDTGESQLETLESTASSTVWGIVAPNGSVLPGPYSTLLTWINVWGS